MKRLLNQELLKLDENIVLSSTLKKTMKKRIFEEVPFKKRRYLAPKFAFIAFIFIVSIATFFIIKEYNTETVEFEQATLTDSFTQQVLDTVPQTPDTFLIEWTYDSMDRGNHDLNTMVHGNLVVSRNISELQRGMIIYLELPSTFANENPNFQSPMISRIVGLPGETIKIEDGQVFVNNQKLDTFYGKATIRGLDEKQYFEQTNPENIANKQLIEEYFKTSIEPIVVEDNTVFVLADNWLRGVDSRMFGLAHMEDINGIILGHE